MIEGIRNVHFIGIGGIGMSGLAEILHAQGYRVTGSDKSSNEQTKRLESLGIRCFVGHEAGHMQGDLVVFTSAVHEDNPELQEARRRGVPAIKRAVLLGETIRRKKSIAVAGTHGKTTTSAMIGMMLDHAGLDPMMIIGGVVNQLGTNARFTRSDWAVVEADEYDRSFLELEPYVAVINNIESDHLDCYRDLEDIQNAFVQFANQASEVLVNADDENISAVRSRLTKPVTTYGFSASAQIRAEGIEGKFGELSFNVLSQNKSLGRVILKMSGRHNVKNALAAVGVGLIAGVPFPKIAEGLAAFRGTGRRFEWIGEWSGATIIDDYAHHPTEIRATLAGLREGSDGRRIVAVFQPHLFSRTRDYFDAFAKAFGDADEVILTEIYPARETPIPGITGERLAESMKKNHKGVTFVAEKQKLPEALQKKIRPKDIVITMGAGDITTVGRELVNKG